MRKLLGILILTFIAVNALPTTATMQSFTQLTLTGSIQVVNNGPGDQTEPHLDCNLISYLNNNLQGSSVIHYLAAPGSPDFVIPGNGLDTQPDVNGSRVAFTEQGAQTTNVAVYDTLSLIRTDIPGIARSNPSLGGELVAYEDRSYLAAPNQSEIGVYDLSTGTDIRLTSDQLFDPNLAGRVFNASAHERGR